MGTEYNHGLTLTHCLTVAQNMNFIFSPRPNIDRALIFCVQIHHAEWYVHADLQPILSRRFLIPGNKL